MLVYIFCGRNHSINFQDICLLSQLVYGPNNLEEFLATNSAKCLAILLILESGRELSLMEFKLSVQTFNVLIMEEMVERSLCGIAGMESPR